MDITKMNLSDRLAVDEIKHVHFTGIKGVGMASLALCFQDLGIKITGSDVKEIFVTDETLKKRKIKWRIGFGEKSLKPMPDLVITTGAHGGLNNPEVLAAQKFGVPVMTHAEALGLVAKTKDTISVCGVGGKTTTTSIIATVLSITGKHPSFAIGVGNIFPLGVPGRYDKKGKEFICEADEFAISPGINNNPRFSFLTPKFLVVTNIEHDHPDIYPTLEKTKLIFKKFFEKISPRGLLVACVDNKNVVEVIRKLRIPIQTYGFNQNNDWHIANFSVAKQESHFSLRYKNGKKLFLTLQIPGRFNVENATASFIVGKNLGLTDEGLRKGLKNYLGCKRRFERIGISKSGFLVYDDYAHHPTEIKSILKAACQWFPRERIVAIFQPHTYSRTKALFADFTKAFNDAGIVAFMDIYASAREVEDKTVSSRILAREAKKYKKEVFYSGNHNQTLEWLKKHTKSSDVVLTMGAGDIFHLHKKLLKI